MVTFPRPEWFSNVKQRAPEKTPEKTPEKILNALT
jgi:hypothetical protein